MARTVHAKVGIASLIMMGSVFLSRVIGLVREMVIAYFGGADGAVDAYLVAFIIPDILNHVAASGFLSITFIPIFSKYLAGDREEEGWHVFSIILSVFGSLLVAGIILAWFFTPQLIALVSPGLTEPVYRNLAIRMTRIILPAQFFFFAGGLLMAVQFAKERFFIPALAPLLYNLGIIAGGVLLGPRLGMEGFSWGVLAGAFIGNFTLQLYGARKVGARFHIRLQLRHPEVIQYVKVTLPLMLGLTMLFSTEFFLKFFGSYLPRGDIASLNYALRIMLILAALFGQAIGTAAFPFMARLVAENRVAEMNRLLNTTLTYLALVIPFAALMMVLRYEVVVILYQRGQFDAGATRQTALALHYLLVGAGAFAVQTVVVRGYYAMQDTLFPAIYSTIAVVFSIPMYLVGMQTMGIKGIALAISLSAILQVLLLYMIWNKRTGNFESRGVYLFYLQMIGISLVLGFILYWVRMWLIQFFTVQTLWTALSISVITGLICLGLLTMTAYLLRIDTLIEGLERLRKGFRGKR